MIWMFERIKRYINILFFITYMYIVSSCSILIIVEEKKPAFTPFQRNIPKTESKTALNAERE